MKHVLLALAACTGSLVASAQHFQCGTDRMRAERIAADPTYLEREAALEAEIQDLLRNSARVERDREVILTIPIVFHVLHLGGSENITNEQILNQLDLLNQDYRALNPDISTVHPAFADLVGDAMIQFALPTLDPQGNCTNGIDRVRTPETLRGDDRSKMNPWPRDKYLNVWIAERMRDGVAGYAYYPGSFEGPVQRLADGIIILNDYIGAIGTSNPFRSTALSHEVGHYLNLPHVWGNNNGVEPGGEQAPEGHMVPDCGEDGVADTPVTRGWDICPDFNDPQFGWGDCNRLSLATFPYDFDGVTTNSGTTDPTPLVNPTDEFLGEDRERAQMLPFTSSGLSANSTVDGKFSFTGWDEAAVDGELSYSEMASAPSSTTKYYSFTVDPNVTDLLFLDSIGFKISRNLNGIRTFAVRSSVSNFLTNLPIRAAGNPLISLQANNVAYITADVALNDLVVYVDPPGGTGYNYNDDPVTFRLYAWNAENANGVVRVCADGAPVDLFDRLGGSPQPGGTWSGPSATDGSFDPTTMLAGTYTYSLDLGGACPTYTASVDVSITPTPEVPVITGNSSFCQGSTTQLSSSITSNIRWATGQTTANITVNAGGTYTVTHTQNGCSATSEPFLLDAITRESAGTNGTLSLCSTSTPVSLFPSLAGAPAVGGAWTGPSEVVDGLYDPNTMEAGAYTYTIAANGPCAQSTATVTVTETATANAGTNGTLSICNNATGDLFDRLGGSPQAGGTWTAPDASTISGTYDAAMMEPGVYTYTVDLGGDCGSSSATVTVSEINAPAIPTISGNNAFCEGGSVQLVSSTSTGNTWLPNGPTTPAFNVTRAGTYTLRVTTGNGCSAVSEPFTVSVQSPVSAGDDAELTACAGASDINLFTALNGKPDIGGTWSGPSEVVDGLYQPASMEPGTYTYSVSGTSPCPNDEATVVVTEANEFVLTPGTFGVDDVVVYGTTNLIENVENYMEYSYCSKMFTMGQVDRMRAAINSDVGERNNLWTEDNLRVTGVAEGFRAACPPQADFYARTVLLNSTSQVQEIPFTPTVCTNEQVQFVDNSVGGLPTSWEWTFEGGTPATSTARNPVVTFDSPGFKQVTLIATNENGSSTKTDSYSILIGGAPNDFAGTYSEGFENTQSLFPWVDMNYANNITSWRRVTTTGFASNACVMLNNADRNFLDLIDPANGADYDDLYSPTFDLSGLSEASMTFAYAYSTTAGSVEEVTERLEVSISTDCGETWSLLPSGNITGAALINNGNNPEFPPPTWSERSLTINASRRVPNVRFRFRFITTETSGNLFIDNINVLGPVGIDDLSAENFMSLYPNPTNDQFTLGVHGMDKFPTSVTITDIRGALVYSNILSPTNQSMQFSATELGLANGLYMINATNEAGNHTQKLMVGK